MSVVCFVDLDDTLLQTEAKCPPGEICAPAAFDRQGRPASFMTAAQMVLVEKMLGRAELVPTTGRSLEALRRVRLPFGSYRITHHGAVVTDRHDGLDEEWSAKVHPALLGRKDQLESAAAAVAHAARRLALPARARVIEEGGVPTYVSVKCESAGELARLAGALELARLGPGLRVHRNGRNMAFLPAETSKRAAVAHVISKLVKASRGRVLTVGLGDSLSDAPFLGVCDFAMCPRGSQIAFALRQLAGEHE